MEKITLLDISNPKKIKETINKVIDDNEKLSRENEELAGAVQDKLSEIVEEQNTTQQVQQQMQQEQGQFRIEFDAAQQKIDQAVKSVAGKADVYKSKLPLTFSWNDVKLGDDISGWTFRITENPIDTPATGFPFEPYVQEVWLKTALGTTIHSYRANDSDAPCFMIGDKRLWYAGTYTPDFSYTFPEGSIVTELNTEVVWDDDAVVIDDIRTVYVDPEYNYKTKADKYLITGSIAVGEDLSGKTLKFDTTVDYYATTGYIGACIVSSGGYIITPNFPNLILGTDLYEGGYGTMANTVVETFATYNSGTTWLMDEYILPDDFGTVTEIDTAKISFISLEDTEVDCEYNYKAIQEIKGGSGGSASGVAGYKWSTTFDETALACCIVGAYDEWDECILQSMLFYRHMEDGTMQAKGIVAYVSDNSTYWFSVTSIYNGTISNTFTQLTREEMDENNFVKRYATQGEGPPFHECTFRYLVKE